MLEHEVRHEHIAEFIQVYAIRGEKTFVGVGGIICYEKCFKFRSQVEERDICIGRHAAAYFSIFQKTLINGCGAVDMVSPSR